ncbi:MAG: CPBP family intramembrane metalloprotease [Planctomycetaceae bacterium]|nr:CPBP family intramembrane metalloprotease [Planctomycetaceae bacterium]
MIDRVTISPAPPTILGHSRPLLFLLIVVNACWVLFIGVSSLLPESVTALDGLTRASVRIGVVLFPSLIYLGIREHGPWLDRLGLSSRHRRGILIGLAVSLIWLLPLLIYRWGSNQGTLNTHLTIGTWLNFILGSPFAEELLYRRIVYRELAHTVSRWKAILLSSLWFTLLHLPPWIGTHSPLELIQHLGIIFVYGLLFALLYQWSQSLWGSLIPHWLNNAVNSLYPAA